MSSSHGSLFFPWLATKALDNFTGDFHIVAVNSLS